MRYLNEDTISKIGNNWNEIVKVIESATKLIDKKDFAQPIKPYLRYKSPKNRIIAMPAYIGGEYNISGIKWIASFPDNINKDIPRANSVIILNNAETGVPISIFNTPKISAIRTAGVTGAVIKAYVENSVKDHKINFGIIGFGPIGKMHLEMILSLFEDKIDRIYLYDIKPIDLNSIPKTWHNKLEIVNSWQDVYSNAKVFMTCTVSNERYIDTPPPKGSLQLNISLRDYKPMILDDIDHIIVDDWEEVCRENTDIEIMNIEKGLKEEDVLTIFEFLFNKKVSESIKKEDVIMFNPMGMAIYDMAIAKYYYNLADSQNQGVLL